MKSLRSRIMHFVRRWHARVGVIAAVFFLFLAISGIALNHTDGLHLAKTPVQASWLMRWYGLRPEIPANGYVFKDGYFAASDERWVLNGSELQDLGLPESKPEIVGAAAWADMYAIASSEHLFLYTKDGKQVDHLFAASLPAPVIERLGLLGSAAAAQLVLKTAIGDFASADGLSWQKLNAADGVAWADKEALPQSLSASLTKSFSPSLPLERIVLDLHSGRFMGSYGPLVMDIAALLLMVLSISGVWIYIRTSRKRPKH